MLIVASRFSHFFSDIYAIVCSWCFLWEEIALEGLMPMSFPTVFIKVSMIGVPV